MSEPTVTQQHDDRAIQREKLRRFLEQRPETFWTQETLAESCGASLGAIRTRLNELKRAGMDLRAKHEDYRDEHGTWHRGLKVWGLFPRPDHPLGRDAADYIKGDPDAARPLLAGLAHLGGFQK